MGMMTKSGKYFANPALGRAHEAAESGSAGGGKTARGKERAERPERESMGGAHSVHIFRDEAGGHHVAAHHAHGVEHSDHGSLEEAMDHAKGEMGADSGDGDADDGQDAAPEHGGLMGTLGGGSY